MQADHTMKEASSSAKASQGKQGAAAKPETEDKAQGKKEAWKAAWDKKMKSKPPAPPCTDGCCCAQANPDAISKAKAHTGRPLKILCLHGGGQTAEGFRSAIANFTWPLVDYHFAQAPNEHHGRPQWMGDAEKQL